MKVSDEAWCLYEKTNVFLMERSIPIRFRDCPSEEPKIDLAQARKLARRCFRKFSKRPLSFYVNRIEAISGSTHTWTNNKKGNGKTLLVNALRGTRGFGIQDRKNGLGGLSMKIPSNLTQAWLDKKGFKLVEIYRNGYRLAILRSVGRKWAHLTSQPGDPKTSDKVKTKLRIQTWKKILDRSRKRELTDV